MHSYIYIYTIITKGTVCYCYIKSNNISLCNDAYTHIYNTGSNWWTDSESPLVRGTGHWQEGTLPEGRLQKRRKGDVYLEVGKRR